MQTTPASLLVRLKTSGESQAWQRLVELYTPLLFYWARQAGIDSPDDADLVQDVFAVLVQKLPRFEYDPRQSFRAWLRTIVVNRARDLHRRRRVSTADFDDGRLDQIAAPPEEAAWEEEYRQLLARRAMEIMRNEFQETTWQACWEVTVNNRSAADAAQMLGISENAVYIAKGRVLRRLRQELDGLFD